MEVLRFLGNNSLTRKTTRHTLLHFFLFVLIVFSLLFASTPEVCAAEVTLAWDPNPEPAVEGYRVYYGKASGFYTNVVDAGNRTDCVIRGSIRGPRISLRARPTARQATRAISPDEIVYATDGCCDLFIGQFGRRQLLHRDSGIRQLARAGGGGTAGVP